MTDLDIRLLEHEPIAASDAPYTQQTLDLPGVGSGTPLVHPVPDCLFCNHADPQQNTVIRRRGTMFARWDNYPAAPGHVELVPFRHVSSFFDLSEPEIKDLGVLSKAVRDRLEKDFHPDGFTLGVNDGVAAGRTVHHLHFHIIPRWFGDVPDPRGGIRRIFPECDPSDWIK